MYYLWLHIFMIPLTVGTILSLKSFRLSWPTPYKIFSTLLMVFWVTETFTILWKYWLFKVFTSNKIGDVYWIYNLSFFIQYFLILYFFHQILKSSIQKIIIKIIGFIYLLFSLFNISYLEGFRALNTYTFAIASAISIFLCVLYFNQLKNEEPVKQLYAIPAVWIATGLFLYHATKYPFILGFNYLTRQKSPLVFTAYNLYLVLGCLFYILFSIAYLCKPHQQK